LAIAGWLGNETMLERAKAAAGKSSYEVVFKDTYALNSPDFVPFFTKLLAAKPDAIQLNSSPISGFLLRAIRQLGFKGPVFSDSPLDPQVIKATSGDAAADNVFCNGMDQESPTPEMKQVTERWAQKYHEPFVSDAWLAWDTASVLHQAIVKADSLDPAAVVAAFEKMTNRGDVQTVFGPGLIAGKESFGVNRVLSKPIPISRIDHGKTTLVRLVLPSAR
jgi:branched-chain amino acid transport system substrate-binding protein